MDIQAISDLIKALEQEARIYDDLLKISKNKTKIIVEGKVSELEAIVKMEQALVMQMGRVEMARESLVDKLAKDLNMKPENLTISELLKLVKGEHEIKLRNAQSKLGLVIRDLKDTNEVNAKLIRNSLDFIDFSMNLMAGAGNTSNNYASTGMAGDTKKRSFFDVKL